ncbi:hypothetical protein [Actinomadura atramentaria]|uniref:hypothetical protein n=1 Tax=Actinomadura atramentaria TaxID=1990 RepID=UPI00037A1225|nr:hypothetical protein [Actinomadura atramentaria]
MSAAAPEDFIEETDETEEERQAREDIEVEIDPLSQQFVAELVEKILLLVDELSGHPLYPYQRVFAYRVIESILLNDGQTTTALFSRQSGKSETVANVVAACLIILPRLAKVYPDLLGKFAEGFWVGAFAPTDEQSDILYGRLVDRLTSERAEAVCADPEIDEQVVQRGRTVHLRKSGSLIRRQTCHPRAKIEGRTYHLIIVDECQDADEKIINKSVAPMGASTNASMIMIGTPGYTKGVFYKIIQHGKRQETKRGSKQLHFEANWKEAAKSNPNYEKFVKREMLRLGTDSDEFKMSYELKWLLEKGQFVTSERLDELGDKSMQVVHAWHASPCVAGLDVARKEDSTVLTVCWVDWDHPDEFGYYDTRILNWLDLTGLKWEEQYFRIVEFLSNYRLYKLGIDAGGLGDVVADRLRVLMPHIEVIDITSSRPEQSKRWKHLATLLEKGMISWPAHAKTRRLKTWRRFYQQMTDVEKVFVGPHMLVEAPDEADAHDDYPDSLALACILTQEDAMPEVQVSNAPFYNAA